MVCPQGGQDPQGQKVPKCLKSVVLSGILFSLQRGLPVASRGQKSEKHRLEHTVWSRFGPMVRTQRPYKRIAVRRFKSVGSAHVCTALACANAAFHDACTTDSGLQRVQQRTATAIWHSRRTPMVGKLRKERSVRIVPCHVSYYLSDQRRGPT